ncbi:MAG: SpoIIIAH-like family protein [Clostridiales bacterium]|nr:SpoIIIAH-like family protein [Clostridiales bacterium]
MFVLKRNPIIISALIVMIAVAGYLNYKDSQTTEQTGLTLNDQGEIDALAPSSLTDGYDIGTAFTYGETDDPSIATDSEAMLTGDVTEEQAQSDGTSSENDPGESVFVSGGTTDTAYNAAAVDSSYFIQAKFDREQSRSKQKSLLTDMINNTNLDQENKSEAAKSMIEIQKRIEKETAAEAMIEAKGFSEVYVRIDDDSVDVVVNKEVLTDAEVAQIEDIVKRKTGMSEDKIHISPMRK